MAAAMLVIVANAGAEPLKSISTGFDYTNGKYGGASTTEVLYLPVTVKYQVDNLTFKLTIPYISVTSTGNVVRGIGPINFKNSNKTVTVINRQAGLGDIVTSAAYILYDNNSVGVDLVGNVKFGTADSGKNLGTGENDYSVQLDGFYTKNKTSLFATLGYKYLGVPPGLILNNIAYGSIGVSQKLDDQKSAGLVLDVAQSTNSASEGKRELSLFVSNKVSNTLKIQGSVLKGFSTGSPDFGASFSVSGTF
jgi:hypothetical protein